ncbi:MAG: hypothetical protein ABI778_05600, partial [Ignavibacteriota bacterium]
PAGTARNAHDLFPLLFGDSWTYKVTTYKPNGSITSDTIVTASFGGITTGPPDAASVYFLDTAYYSAVSYDSLEIYRRTFYPTISSLYIKYPMAVAEVAFSYNVPTQYNTFESQTIRFDSTNALVNAGFESFSTYKFHTFRANVDLGKADTIVTDSYFAQGKGLMLERQYRYAPSGNLYLWRNKIITAYTVK